VRPTSLLLNLFVTAVAIMIVAPIVMVLLTSFSASDYIRFPPEGLSFKHYIAAAGKSHFVDALWTSAVVAITASLLSVVLGTMAAVGLTRYDFRGRAFIQAMLNSPLMIPALVIGIALLHFYSVLQVAPNLFTIMGGHLMITVPYSVRLLSASLAGVDRRLELAAMSLGATPLKAFIQITLPNIAAGLLGAFTFSAIMSFDDIGVSLFISPSSRPTLPVAIFSYLDQTYDPLVVAVSSVMIFVSVVAIIILDRTVGVSRIFVNAQIR
jgi:putative spermidine/putrescine transport system permease protein